MLDSDDFNGVDNDRADHNKDFFSPGVVNDKDVDNDQTDNDQQNKQDVGPDDTIRISIDLTISGIPGRPGRKSRGIFYCMGKDRK